MLSTASMPPDCTARAHDDRAPSAADVVIARLEEAGATLLAMGGRRVGPASLTAQSQGWPVVHDAAEAYGWSGARARAGYPDADAIDRMDEALRWVEFIPPGQYVLRRIVGARCLVSPITGRYLFSWRRISTLMGADHRAVMRWHRIGIELIVAALGGGVGGA